METLETPTREASSITLSIPELKAVLEHKYVLSYNSGDWVSMPHAISDFFAERLVENPADSASPYSSYAHKFKTERLREDWKLQQDKISEEIRTSEERIGRPLSEDEKKLILYDWLGWKAEEWREKRDSMEEIFGNKYEKIIIPSVQDVLAVKKRVIGKLCPYWCDVFLHQTEMYNPDFVVEQKPYQDAKRRIKKENAEVSIRPKERLEILLIGDKSGEAKEGLLKCMCEKVLFEIPEEDHKDN